MIELSPEQQAKEDSRLAKEVLENPVFKATLDEYIDRFTMMLLNLNPEDKEAFPLTQGPRKHLIALKNQIQAIADTTTADKEPSRIVS